MFMKQWILLGSPWDTLEGKKNSITLSAGSVEKGNMRGDRRSANRNTRFKQRQKHASPHGFHLAPEQM